MIAQSIAIKYPQCILSLTSRGSTTGNPELPLPNGEAGKVAIAECIDNREAAAKRAIDLNRVAGSPAFPTSKERLVEKAYRDYDRAFDAQGVARQIAAVLARGDRRPGLRKLKIKALIIHGLSDPLVHSVSAIELHENIMGSKLMLIDGLGHELPEGMWVQVISAIQNMIE